MRRLIWLTLQQLMQFLFRVIRRAAQVSRVYGDTTAEARKNLIEKLGGEDKVPNGFQIVTFDSNSVGTKPYAYLKKFKANK